MMSFLDEATLDAQVDESDPFYEDLKSLVSDKHLINELVEDEIKSMRDNREQTVISCGNNVIRPVGRTTETEAQIFYNLPFIEEICLGTSPKIIHHHGVYLSYQSEQDKRAHADFFAKGFRMGCAVGIDGIHCLTPLGKFYKIPWTDKFYARLKDEGFTMIPQVKHITCTNSNSLGKNNRECILELKKGLPRQRVVVNEYIIEQKGSPLPWLLVGENYNLSYLERAFSKHGEEANCVVTDVQKPERQSFLESMSTLPFTLRDRLREVPRKIKKKIVGNDKRILSCFFRDIE